MISSGPPQVFVPFGREHSTLHTGDPQPHPVKYNLPSTSVHTDAGEDILDAIREFSLTDHNVKKNNDGEEWKLRLNIPPGGVPHEEELYYSGNTAVWSKGVGPSCQETLMSFTTDQPIQHALWCNFLLCPETPIGHVSTSEPLMEGEKLPSVCILNSSKLNVFFADGQEFVVPLPFQITGVWPIKYGLLFERKITPVSSGANLGIDSLPVFFSLTHPLDEITPVVHHTSSGRIGFITNNNQRVVHAFEDPSLVLTYDIHLGIHTVWKIRWAKTEEGLCAVHGLEPSFNLNYHQQWITAAISPLTTLTGSSFSRFLNFSSPASSPLRALTSRPNSPLVRSRPRSPGLSNLTHMATISRSQSPVATNNTAYSIGGTPSPNSRSSAALTRTPISMNSSCAMDVSDLREPLEPSICLESIWVEPKLSASRDSMLEGQASKVFFTKDVLGQSFLCFLVPNYSQLRCVKVDEYSDQKRLLFGSLTPISARDAAGLEGSPLILVIDTTGSLLVYTGITKICKVHIPLGSNPLCSSIGALHSFAPIASSRRNSIVTSSRPPSALDARFDDEARMLSPVPTEMNLSSGELQGPPFLEDLSLNISSTLSEICDAVENKVTLKYANGLLHRITIPTFTSCTIVNSSLDALRCVLPRELVYQLFSKWYTVSHAPGSSDTTPLHYWTMFASFLLAMMGYDVDSLNVFHHCDLDTSSISEVIVKKFKTSENGGAEDWDYLLCSHHHSVQPDSYVSSGNDSTSGNIFAKNINTDAPLFSHIPAILFCLHLLYEEFKLDKLHWNVLPHIAKILYCLARDLHNQSYMDFYWRDFADVIKYEDSATKLDEAAKAKLNLPAFMTPDPPSIFQWIEAAQQGKNPTAFPCIPSVNKRIRTVTVLYTVLNKDRSSQEVSLNKCTQPIVSAGSRTYSCNDELQDLNSIEQCSSNAWEATVIAMVFLDVKYVYLESLPVGIALPLQDAIGRCRQNPPSDWPVEAYILIGREDLAAQLGSPLITPTPASVAQHKVPKVAESRSPIVVKDNDDGMEHMDQELLQLHFSHDLRVQEVRRLLQSANPARIALVQRPEVSDHEFIEEQERHLYSICIRTMALAVGRGMFTLRTSKPVVTEVLPIPKLCLTGRAPPRNTTLDLTHIDVPTNMNTWPLFHNGVAAGLRISSHALEIDSTWIVYNKPKGNTELPIEHAGFLMALGLNGHLKNLATMDIYGYAVKGHEMTSVGLLLGIAAARRGTMDLAATKLLSIHVEALLPPTSTELDIPHIVQVTAVLGIGLVYQGTAHRHMAEVLMSEIGRPPGPEMENSSDRESYSLAAGLALGLVTMGKGSNVAGLSDLGMADHLYHYMIGGPKRPMTGPMREKYKSASYQIKEGDAINVDVTSPGATMALGFMFFGTNDRTVAEWMTAPDTQHLLDFVRPDFLLLRTLSKGLILWDEVMPSASWVESHVPEIISSAAILREQQNFYVDIETLSQAYCNIIAGACMILGMRFAGTANEDAYTTLLKYARTFIGLLGKSASEQAGRTTVETCMNVVVLSLAVVMAGTGDLEVLRLCRHLHARVGQPHSHVLYGSHMATHMAIGLLFLGGGRYTLSTNQSSVAAMICAFFPKFPTHSNDNRYHLQAFRHLYVLAVEPRLIIPRDVDTGNACYTHFAVKFKASKWYDDTTLILKAPFLLPQLELLSEVSIKDPRYWPVTFSVDKNWETLVSLLDKDGTICVKQRTGCLSYIDDPNGFHSLLGQSLVKDKSGKWTAKPKAIKTLTSDPTVHSILSMILHGSPRDNEKERIGHSLLSHLMYECVTQEKLEVFPSLISLMQIRISERQTSLDLWQTRLIATSLKNFCGQPMINEEAFVALMCSLDKLCNDFPEDALARYWGGEPLQSISSKLIPFLILNRIPPSLDLKMPISSAMKCLPLFWAQFENAHLPCNTIFKLHQNLCL